ncbi:MAG: hypothetical protein ACO1RT_05750 [Planctomycetaceae bacterium]
MKPNFANVNPIAFGLSAALSAMASLFGCGASQALANESSLSSAAGRRVPAAIVAVANTPAVANMPAADGSAARPEKDRKRTRIEPSDEGIGLALAVRHLQELIPVLDHLREHSPPQYEKALRDLDRSAKRLESIKRRDAKLYEISLREWRIRGQIDLLKAKLRVKATDADQREMLQRLKTLRQAEKQRIERELVLIDEREAAYKDRIGQLSALIERGDSLREQLNDQLQRLESEPLDKNSASYLRAIGASKNDPARSATSSKPKFKKATNE